MPSRKPTGKVGAKAKAGYEAAKVEEAPAEEVMSAEQQEARRIFTERRNGVKWCEAQLEIFMGPAGLCEITKEAGIKRANEDRSKQGSHDWLVVAHEFHQKKITRTRNRLKEKELDSVPQEVQEGVAAYLAQFPNKETDCNKDDIKLFQQVWDCCDEQKEQFVRRAETDEDKKVIEEIRAWSGQNVADMAKFTGLLQANLISAGVQEAGLMRLGWLCTEAQKEGAPPADGLTVKSVLPAIKAGMEKHMADAPVQKAGCAALRGLALIDGQLGLLCDAGGATLAVNGLMTHFKDKDVAVAANGFFWAGGQKAGKNSAENAIMRHAGAIDALAKVMTYWAWDQTLCGRIRVTLPFLEAD
jgi:hypothetical protein